MFLIKLHITIIIAERNIGRFSHKRDLSFPDSAINTVMSKLHPPLRRVVKEINNWIFFSDANMVSSE
jgi:hypothetical protein